MAVSPPLGSARTLFVQVQRLASFASVQVGAGVHRGRVEEKPATRGHGGCYRFCADFTPGLLLRWRPLAAVLLGGVTYISSSGVIAKVLAELRRMEKPETPLVPRCWCRRTWQWLSTFRSSPYY